MLKIKHLRTADCVVAGFRWHKSGEDAIGSLLLGLYDDAKVLQHIGSTSAFSMPTRRAFAKELEPLRPKTLEGRPWAGWGEPSGQAVQRMPGTRSRTRWWCPMRSNRPSPGNDEARALQRVRTQRQDHRRESVGPGVVTVYQSSQKLGDVVKWEAIVRMGGVRDAPRTGRHVRMDGFLLGLEHPNPACRVDGAQSVRPVVATFG